MSTLVASTGTIQRSFGNFSAQIEMGSGTIVERDMSLKSLPTLTQDFDLQEEVADINEIKINLSDITIKIFDGLSEGESLFSYIQALSLNDTIQIQITTPAGTDYFISSKASCKYDWRARTVELTGQAALRFDVEVTGYSIVDKTSNEGWVAPYDLIQKFLSTQGASPTLKIIGSYFDTYDVSILNGPPIDDLKYLVFPDTSVTSYAQAKSAFLRLSVIEAAMIGTMMGYAFYVRRNFNSESNSDHFASISASNLKNFGVEFNQRSVRNIDYDFRFEDQTGQPVYTFSDVINSSGSQDLDVAYISSGYKTVQYNDGLQEYVEVDVTEDSALEVGSPDGITTIGSNAKDSYHNALGIESSYKVDFEIFGITTLKPYQFISFASDIHPTVNGKKIRPSYLEYDLQNDVVKGEGYIIG
jgi:hypothetical protein